MSKISNVNAGLEISGRRVFSSHTGSFWSKWCDPDNRPTMGMLPEAHRHTLSYLVDQARHPYRSVYVVFSYDTPIAWFDPSNGWAMPDEKYSNTTSRHQGIVRRAVDPYMLGTAA